MPHWKPKSDVRATPVGEKLMLLSATMGRNQWMCYRLATELGDLMFHPPDRVKSVEEHPEFFFEPSRIKHIVLTHRGDYSAGAAKLAEDWGATFYAHRDELDALGVAGTAFTEDHAITPELEAICLPGHGAGYTCYLYRDQGTGYLLSGHLITRARTPVGSPWRGGLAGTLYRERGKHQAIARPAGGLSVAGEVAHGSGHASGRTDSVRGRDTRAGRHRGTREPAARRREGAEEAHLT